MKHEAHIGNMMQTRVLRAACGMADTHILLFAQHAMKMYRRSLPDGSPRHCLDHLSNRLTKILSEESLERSETAECTRSI